MTPPRRDLAAFFQAFAPLLELTGDVAAVERALGGSPSGSRRMGFYGVLARRTRLLSLGELCPAFRYATQKLGERAWLELALRYAELHPPRHADPNRFAEGFSEFIASERERGLPLPSYFEELAEYEFTLWEVGITDFQPTFADVGLDRTIRVRQYSCNVANFVSEFHAGRSPAPPAPGPVVLLVYQDTRSGFPRTFFPTAAGLAALARRAGRSLPSAQLDAQMLSAAEQELVEHGVLIGDELTLRDR